MKISTDNKNDDKLQGPPYIDGLLARMPHQHSPSSIKIGCYFHCYFLAYSCAMPNQLFSFMYDLQHLCPFELKILLYLFDIVETFRLNSNLEKI